MAPKKKCFNGFSIYMSDTQQDLSKKGIKKSMSELPEYCKEKWEAMSDEKKAVYKARGKNMNRKVKVTKYTSIGEKVDDIKQQSIDTKLQTDDMYSYIEASVSVEQVKLSRNKFILIHVNPYTCESEGFYFPAEISMAEFSLQKGLIRIFHQLVGFDKVRTNAPPAPTADINTHAESYHKILTFSTLPLNYTNIFLKIIGFIMDKDVDESVLNDGSLDLPPIYTAHCSTTNELMITSSSLYQLYESAVEGTDRDHFNRLIRVYHLDKLFMEMKNLSYVTKNPNATEKAIPSVAMATETLSKDMLNTIKSVGCNYHEKLEHVHVCSNYYVCKWIFILSTHCCQYFNIKLIPGCHYDFELSTAETPVEEIFENFNISKNFNISSDSFKTKTKDLTIKSFPSLKVGGLLSTAVAQQPVWNRPPSNKPIHNMSTLDKTISNKNNFPPLGSSQKVGPEKTPATEMNSWQKNVSLGRGQVHNNTNQLDRNPKKLSKGRGFNVGGK